MISESYCIDDYKKYLIKNTIIISLLIIIQTIHSYISVITYIGLIIYAIRGKVNSLKALLLSLLIYFLNPGLFKLNNSLCQALRWILLFVSIYVIMNRFKYRKSEHKWIMIFILWGFYMIIISLLNSKLPMVSIFKIIVFIIPFITVNIGIQEIYENYDIKIWLCSYFSSIQYLSIVLLFIPVGYFTNNEGFQGILNQPNVTGIVMAMIISFYIYLINNKNYESIKSLISINIIISTVFLFKSLSRTSMLALASVVILLVLLNVKDILFTKTNLKIILVSIFICLSSTIILIIFNKEIAYYADNLINKRNDTHLLYSSENIIKKNVEEFKQHPLLGNGFGIYNNDIPEKSLKLNLSYPVEKRNIILAILSEGGIIGIIIFAIFIIMYTNAYKRFYFVQEDVIFLCIFMVNMAEMIFFSSNGLGVLSWFLLAIYRIEISKYINT